jgi:hypothetical protein
MNIVEMIESSKEDVVYLSKDQAIELVLLGKTTGKHIESVDGMPRLADYAGKKLFIDFNKIDESNLLKS